MEIQTHSKTRIFYAVAGEQRSLPYYGRYEATTHRRHWPNDDDDSLEIYRVKNMILTDFITFHEYIVDNETDMKFYTST